MNKPFMPFFWGAVVALYLRFGLEPTGWLFYELSFATGIDFLYWGYSGFRGAGHFFDLWQYQNIVCAVVAMVVVLLLIKKRQSQ